MIENLSYSHTAHVWPTYLTHTSIIPRDTFLGRLLKLGSLYNVEIIIEHRNWLTASLGSEHSSLIEPSDKLSRTQSD